MNQTAVERRTIDWWWLLSTAALAAALTSFAVAHFALWRSSGRPVGLGLMLQESVVAALIVVRRRPRGTSHAPVAWLATAIGTFGMLAARPNEHALFALQPLWVAVQIVGVVMAAFSLGSLGRSFGLVAANRGVQTRGAYRIVRHPAYACYFITYAGYLCENPSPWNAVLVVMVVLFQLMRIRQEEAYLAQDAAYVRYQRAVRYRLVPFLY